MVEMISPTLVSLTAIAAPDCTVEESYNVKFPWSNTWGNCGRHYGQRQAGIRSARSESQLTQTKEGSEERERHMARLLSRRSRPPAATAMPSPMPSRAVTPPISRSAAQPSWSVERYRRGRLRQDRDRERLREPELR
jgi:hypothetical protein